MSMVVDKVSRTGSASSAMRQLVVTQGEGKNAVSKVLSPPIMKYSLAPPEFRFGAKAKPMEQYCFKVGNVVCERFADATAVVLQQNAVLFSSHSDHQNYVVKAIEMLTGKEQIHYLPAEMPTTAKLACAA